MAKASAREEAAFARGDVGVDGQSTEEKADQAEVERQKARDQFLRGKSYLGREFLSWLLWRSESGDPLLVVAEAPVTLLFCDRLVLRGIAGEIVEETIRGAMAPYSPLVRQALGRGLLIHSGRLRLQHGEREYQVTLDAEFLDLKSAKLPELPKEDGDEDTALADRLDLADQLMALVQALLESFLRLRASKKWLAETVPSMKAWMLEPLPKLTPK